MKRLLTITIIILCFALTLVLGACSSLTYSVQIAAGGQRTLCLTVNLEEGMTEAERLSIKSFLQTVADNRNRNGRNCVVKEGEGFLMLKEEFDSSTDYYIAMGLTGDEPNEDAMPYVDLNAYFLEYSSEMRLADRATVVGYAMQYAAADTEGDILVLWRGYLSGLSTMRPDDPLQPLYARLAYSTPATDLLNDTVAALSGSQGEAFCEVVADWLAENGYVLEAVSVRYNYEHIYRSVYAKTYTTTFKNPETGATVYQWEMTAADIPDTTIVIYQKAPRTWAWELTAIGAGVLTIAIILTIILIKRRKINNATGQ